MKYTSFTNDLRCMKCNKKLAETAGVFPALVGAKAPNDGVNDYGKGLFDKTDFERLRDVLKSCQGKWLVSINNVPQIRELFKGYEFKEVKTSYSINKGETKPVTELLIANYKLD